MIKVGSVWAAGDREFTVLAVVELDGHTWVHYRDQKGQEYSCYEGAFTERFTECKNYRYH